jgi:hypothetical protein
MLVVERLFKPHHRAYTLVGNMLNVDACSVDEHRVGEVNDGPFFQTRRSCSSPASPSPVPVMPWRWSRAVSTTRTNGVAPTTEIGVMPLRESYEAL